ncbi:MAG: ASKHA domain-containing protein [Deltaproteobacteria bacterium]|jgi:uncharacterized 2Fe-2S/4Fe-4S cluster protein (DUF4445 family)|nr:ASKHA domain-containing protein [Deltaproteobacteria bacterium]
MVTVRITSHGEQAAEIKAFQSRGAARIVPERIASARIVPERIASARIVPERIASAWIVPERKVFLDQLDVRQIQLAKGAIAAAMEMLMERLGMTLKDIDEIVIAGSFGYHLRAKSLKTIKLIPKDFEGPVTSAGNSSLAGSARMLLNKDSPAEALSYTREVEVIELGFDPKFQTFFVNHLAF